MMVKELSDVGVTFEATIYLTLGGRRFKVSREQAERLHAELGAALTLTPQRVTANGHTPKQLTHGPVENALSPVAPPAPSPAEMKYGPWSQRDKQHLKSSIIAGRPIENVARTLGRTVAACEQQCERLGIDRCGRPIPDDNRSDLDAINEDELDALASHGRSR
jgi:hypothetical protein